jgi:hypothetical protein
MAESAARRTCCRRQDKLAGTGVFRGSYNLFLAVLAPLNRFGLNQVKPCAKGHKIVLAKNRPSPILGQTCTFSVPTDSLFA